MFKHSSFWNIHLKGVTLFCWLPEVLARYLLDYYSMIWLHLQLSDFYHKCYLMWIFVKFMIRRHQVLQLCVSEQKSNQLLKRTNEWNRIFFQHKKVQFILLHLNKLYMLGKKDLRLSQKPQTKTQSLFPEKGKRTKTGQSQSSPFDVCDCMWTCQHTHH